MPTNLVIFLKDRISLLNESYVLADLRTHLVSIFRFSWCRYVRIEPAFGTTARMAVDGEIVPTSRIEIEVKPSLMRMYGPPPFEWKLADLR